MPRIRRRHDAVHLELALLADRDLGTRRYITAKTHDRRQSTMAPGRRRLVPAGLLGDGIEHSQLFR